MTRVLVVVVPPIKCMPTDIEEAKSAFREGVDRDAAQAWRSRAQDSAGDYSDEFADCIGRKGSEGGG